MPRFDGFMAMKFRWSPIDEVQLNARQPPEIKPTVSFEQKHIDKKLTN